MHILRHVGLILATLLLVGCASTLAPHNRPIELAEPSLPLPSSGYRDSLASSREGFDALMIGLSFSGGGSRAAALAYGVLEELARTSVERDGQRYRMLDLVEDISAVSGGSYTAAYYGLFGDRIFEDFEQKFLKRNVQREIAATLLSPSNLFSMSSPYYGRSDVLAEYLDETLFEQKTFADLERAVREHGRPFVMINATDMGRTSRFEFTQNQFDLLCSDLGPYRVSRAVAASGAVPVVFSPVTLVNYADRCTLPYDDDIERALGDRQGSIRRYALAADIKSYRDAARRKYIHLLDGGLSDNLGLRAMLDRLALRGAGRLTESQQRPALRRIVRIAVNAQVHSDFPQLDQFAEVPTLSAIAYAVGNTTDRFNVETLAYARSSMNDIARELAQKQFASGVPGSDDVQAMLIEIGFDELGDSAERAYFNALPTSFNLPPEAIDRLKEVGARQLRESPVFQRLVRELPTLR